jgi:hypothetical protein
MSLSKGVNNMGVSGSNKMYQTRNHDQYATAKSNFGGIGGSTFNVITGKLYF